MPTAPKETTFKPNKIFFDNFHAKCYNNDILNMKVREVMIYKNDISSLKEEIGEKIGQKIIVKGSLGRNKPFEEEAIIKETYPNKKIYVWTGYIYEEFDSTQKEIIKYGYNFILCIWAYKNA